jgi:hypothetical protein
MTGQELVARVRTRGGELRVRRGQLQYRPAGILASAELDWLTRHRVDVEAALRICVGEGTPGSDLPSALRQPPLGEAGPTVPAWHCLIDLGTGHVMGLRTDGTTYCSTCHPSTMTTLHPRST